jgi:hypothetical protein
MARLDLIRFDSGAYGLQEVDDQGKLTALWNHEADQLEFQERSWEVIRTLAQDDAYDPDDPDDFWRALFGVPEISPPEDSR